MTPADARRAELLTALVRDLRERDEHAEADRVRMILRRVIGKGARAQRLRSNCKPPSGRLRPPSPLSDRVRPSAQVGLFE